ncbi:MAG: hypothetical protein IIY55_11955, partial [Blautia sp.]|nr:hypothetical protein [Blautia sp.]
MIFAVCCRTERQAIRDSYFWIDPKELYRNNLYRWLRINSFSTGYLCTAPKEKGRSGLLTSPENAV